MGRALLLFQPNAASPITPLKTRSPSPLQRRYNRDIFDINLMLAAKVLDRPPKMVLPAAEMNRRPLIHRDPVPVVPGARRSPWALGYAGTEVPRRRPETSRASRVCRFRPRQIREVEMAVYT